METFVWTALFEPQHVDFAAVALDETAIEVNAQRGFVPRIDAECESCPARAMGQVLSVRDDRTAEVAAARAWNEAHVDQLVLIVCREVGQDQTANVAARLTHQQPKPRIDWRAGAVGFQNL